MPKVRLGKRDSEAEPPPQDSATSKADALALLEEAEAEAAEAEALAAAARARARVARLRREVQAQVAAETESREIDAETATAESAETDSAETQSAETESAEADAATESADVADADSAPVEAGEVAEERIPDADPDDAEEFDAETDEDVAETPRKKSRPARRRRRWPSLSASSKAAAVLLICALVGVSGYMLWYDRDAASRQQRAANFIAGARQGVINMTSLDFNRAKEDVQRLLDCSTGEFKDDFQQRAKDFVTVVEQSKVVTQGTINATGLESMSEHSASVLVAATSRITNAAGAKDEPRVWRLRVTVTEEGGQYKMSKLEFIA